MNRLHEALTHLISALRILGKKQPSSDIGCYMKILKEALRHYLHVFLPGYYIGGAGYEQPVVVLYGGEMGEEKSPRNFCFAAWYLFSYSLFKTRLGAVL